ncbi:P-loop containing nucleoside triphosphate hydrolase protein [Pilatotrama ljubarskyi]|nr:P-loop containing nucleoside triphosphate hydrolase protein [Pilatotrama ljubarskyi]
MLNRRKPLSHKQRREQLMLKRAVKRGDISPPPPSKPDRRTRKPRKAQTAPPHSAESARRLESSFVKLPTHFLKKTEILASNLPLARPLQPEAAILSDVDTQPKIATDALADGTRSDSQDVAQLTCPRRPKWRYDMSKKEVEANEEGLFKKWLAQTDEAVNAWCSVDDPEEKNPQRSAQGSDEIKEPDEMPHAPTSFERNLEVWRQLWRVTEISQILLILLDSRCPTLHFPPALSSYLSSVSNASRLRTVLVLTKVDIAGPDRAAAWTSYLQARFPGARVVQVESFVEKPIDANGSKRRGHEPHLPSAFRKALVDALRETHAELLEPPEEVKSNPERLKNWKPRVKTQLNWDAVLKAHGGKVGTAVGAHKTGKADGEGHTDGEHTDEESEPEFLTVGVIGKTQRKPRQPNVGKSSLLNALFETTKVRASRTPGKTKHFQTLFWTPEVRLVDCPGLVFPNYVPMETQVLSGILPISRVSAIPLCIHHAAQLLPLETILGLEGAHPALAEPPAEDKRTWRAGMQPRSAAAAAETAGQGKGREVVWTAMDILSAYATKKGWITARVGRPDVKRAGNAILRALAEGRIRWAFWPPGTDPSTIRAHQPQEGAGIWIGAHDGQDALDLDEAEHEHETPHTDEAETTLSEQGSEDGEEDEDEEEEEGEGGTAGRFGALVLDDQDEEDEDGD